MSILIFVDLKVMLTLTKKGALLNMEHLTLLVRVLKYDVELY